MVPDSIDGHKPIREVSRKPIMDILDDGDKLIITLEMPGINPDHLEIDVHEKLIIVKVQIFEHDLLEDLDFLVCERRYNFFYREIELPVQILPELTRHSYKRGLLEIVLVKA